ncbi:MAG: DUF4271 domain-containing protein [Bacteroidia bacterium]|nr:DUF4271 domain-containing protein [Bacteroidia bacterium]
MILARDTITAPDTLALRYREHYVSTDSLLSTVYTTQASGPVGIEGTPIPYSTRTDNFIAAILLGCFILTAFILSRGKKRLSQQIKELVSHRKRNNLFDSSSSSDLRYSLLLIVQTCILGGILYLDYFINKSPQITTDSSPHLLLGLYTLACMSYIFIKWLLYNFLGWIFLNKETTRDVLSSYATIVYYFGFGLFALTLFTVYFDLSLNDLTLYGVGLIILAKILTLYKWIKFFFNTFHGLILLILYFCALEIVPYLLLYQGLSQMNHILLIKL